MGSHIRIKCRARPFNYISQKPRVSKTYPWLRISKILWWRSIQTLFCLGPAFMKTVNSGGELHPPLLPSSTQSKQTRQSEPLLDLWTMEVIKFQIIIFNARSVKFYIVYVIDTLYRHHHSNRLIVFNVSQRKNAWQQSVETGHKYNWFKEVILIS